MEQKKNHELNAEVTTLYDRVGGDPFFTELVERFYRLVESDQVLRPMYPEDLEPGKQYLAAFLVQFWGGPRRYSEKRGHPRLRQRHSFFPIGQSERDSWVSHMNAAIFSMNISVGEAALLSEYFGSAATLMMNT